MASRKKTGGRQVGSVNKITSPVKETIVKIITEQLESQKLQDSLDGLSGKDYIDAITKLLPYVARKEPQEVVATDAIIVVRKRQ
jgi:hypothetical protein